MIRFFIVLILFLLEISSTLKAQKNHLIEDIKTKNISAIKAYEDKIKEKEAYYNNLKTPHAKKLSLLYKQQASNVSNLLLTLEKSKQGAFNGTLVKEPLLSFIHKPLLEKKKEIQKEKQSFALTPETSFKIWRKKKPILADPEKVQRLKEALQGEPQYWDLVPKLGSAQLSEITFVLEQKEAQERIEKIDKAFNEGIFTRRSFSSSWPPAASPQPINRKPYSPENIEKVQKALKNAKERKETVSLFSLLPPSVSKKPWKKGMKSVSETKSKELMITQKKRNNNANAEANERTENLSLIEPSKANYLFSLFPQISPMWEAIESTIEIAKKKLNTLSTNCALTPYDKINTLNKDVRMKLEALEDFIARRVSSFYFLEYATQLDCLQRLIVNRWGVPCKETFKWVGIKDLIKKENDNEDKAASHISQIWTALESSVDFQNVENNDIAFNHDDITFEQLLKLDEIEPIKKHIKQLKRLIDGGYGDSIEFIKYKLYKNDYLLNKLEEVRELRLRCQKLYERLHRLKGAPLRVWDDELPCEEFILMQKTNDGWLQKILENFYKDR